MVKLLRLSRMAKLLHAVPELTIIMKGIKLATRSVPWSTQASDSDVAQDLRV